MVRSPPLAGAPALKSPGTAPYRSHSRGVLMEAYVTPPSWSGARDAGWVRCFTWAWALFLPLVLIMMMHSVYDSGQQQLRDQAQDQQARELHMQRTAAQLRLRARRLERQHNATARRVGQYRWRLRSADRELREWRADARLRRREAARRAAGLAAAERRALAAEEERANAVAAMKGAQQQRDQMRESWDDRERGHARKMNKTQREYDATVKAQRAETLKLVARAKLDEQDRCSRAAQEDAEAVGAVADKSARALAACQQAGEQARLQKDRAERDLSRQGQETDQRYSEKIETLEQQRRDAREEHQLCEDKLRQTEEKLKQVKLVRKRFEEEAQGALAEQERLEGLLRKSTGLLKQAREAASWGRQRDSELAEKSAEALALSQRLNDTMAQLELATEDKRRSENDAAVLKEQLSTQGEGRATQGELLKRATEMLRTARAAAAEAKAGHQEESQRLAQLLQEEKERSRRELAEQEERRVAATRIAARLKQELDVLKQR